MLKRLAITISGAVPSGSQVAGGRYEVNDATGHHNRYARTSEDEKIVIDVVSGASTGKHDAAKQTIRLGLTWLKLE
jgi:hypothetical protein